MPRHTGIARTAPADGGPEPMTAQGPDTSDGAPTPKQSAELFKLITEGDKVALELTQLQGTALDDKELQERKGRALSREQAELEKVSAEKEKAKLELAQLRGKVLDDGELQAQKRDETKKRTLELAKLRRDADNAWWSPWFELGKVFVPALAIATSIYLGTLNIGQQQQRDKKAADDQRNKDRRVEVAQHLAHFQNQITATVEAIDKSRQPDVGKQRNAVAVVRSLRGDAIPSLLANLDLNHDQQVLQALNVALLELNEDRDLRFVVRKELLSSVKYAAIRIDFHSLDRYIELWRDCINQYRKVDDNFVRESILFASRLAEEMKAQAQQKSINDKSLSDKILRRLIETIDGLVVKP
jgi:hypothetical protein